MKINIKKGWRERLRSLKVNCKSLSSGPYYKTFLRYNILLQWCHKLDPNEIIPNEIIPIWDWPFNEKCKIQKSEGRMQVLAG
jgi:hypothetical protein